MDQTSAVRALDRLSRAVEDLRRERLRVGSSIRTSAEIRADIEAHGARGAALDSIARAEELARRDKAIGQGRP